MNTLLGRLKTSDSGVAILMVMGWGLVLAMLVSAGIGYAIQSNLVAHRGQDWGSALSAAQAGLEDYVARLNRNDNYGRNWDCTNAAMRGPNEPGNTCGWTSSTAPGWIPVVGNDPTAPSFHYDVDASNLDKTGTIRVVSTGRDGKESRTVEAAIGRGGSTDFLYYTDLEDADPANTTAYSSNTNNTKYYCGGSGAQTDIYWWNNTSRSGASNGNACAEITFASTDVLNGRVHFNDTPLSQTGATFLSGFETSNPACQGATSPWSACLRSNSGQPVFGTPASNGNPAVVVPPTWSPTLYLEDTSAKFATYPGCHYYGSTRVKFTGGGKMTVWSADSVGKTTGPGDTCGKFTTWPFMQANLDIPKDGVIYVSAGSAAHRCKSGEISPSSDGNINPPTSPNGGPDQLPVGTYVGNDNTKDYSYDKTMLSPDQYCGMGNIYVEGTVQGRVTLAAENSIVVTGDIVLANGVNGTDLVGLVAGNSVEVFHPYLDTWSVAKKAWNNSPYEMTSSWPSRYIDPATGANNPASGIQIDASIQTLQHSFWVQNYSVSKSGTLQVLGSIAQRWRGIVGQGNPISSGYSKLYQYDSRLKYSSPPYFPQWTNAKWGPRHTGEQTPKYSPNGSYIG